MSMRDGRSMFDSTSHRRTGLRRLWRRRLEAQRVFGATRVSVLRWLAVMSLATAVLWWFRPMLDKAHMAMAFLLVVLVASARHGWRLGRKRTLSQQPTRQPQSSRLQLWS